MGRHLSCPGSLQSMPSASLGSMVMALAFSRVYTYFRGIKSYRVTVTQVHHYLRTWHFCNLQRQRQRRCRGDYHSFDINPIPAPWMIPTARGRSSSVQDWADGFVGRICKPIHSRSMDGIGHRETQVSLAVHSATHRRLFGREPSPGFWLFLSLPSAEVRNVFFVFGPYLAWRGFLFGRRSEKWRERLMFFFFESTISSLVRV